MVFLGFYNVFVGQELETTVKTKKNHQNCILRDSLEMVVFWFFLVFTVVLVVFLAFKKGFGGQELESTVTTRKTTKTRF